MVLAQNLLAPNLGLIVWMTISFLVLLLLLYRFAWGPITTAITSREEKIRESMEQAERALAEARDVQAENTRARREADAQAQKLLRSSREEAERLRSEEVEKTRSQIQQMQDQARVEIDREKESALDSLRQEVADLAIKAAEKILRDTIDADRQKKIVDDFLGEISGN